MPAAALTAGQDQGAKLLVVEDNPEVREFIVHIFREEFRVITADNGKKGIAQAEKHHPDLIISDLMMPVMDGLEFCKELRTHEELVHIPVIILTARTASVFQLEGLQSGADVYITKPFDPNILKAQVKGLLNVRAKLRDAFGKKITLQPTEVEITSLEGDFISSAIKIVEENLSNEDLNRDFLAQALAVSPSSLYRKLKGLTGLNTNAFIRSIRLKRAAQMMQRTDYNISEIAYQVGFNDLKYFRKSFKKQFGLSPSQFLKSQDVKPAEISD